MAGSIFASIGPLRSDSRDSSKNPTLTPPLSATPDLDIGAPPTLNLPGSSINTVSDHQDWPFEQAIWTTPYESQFSDNQGSSDSTEDQPTTEHVEFAETQNTVLDQVSFGIDSHIGDQTTWEHIEFADVQGTVEDEEVVEDSPAVQDLDLRMRPRQC